MKKISVWALAGAFCLAGMLPVSAASETKAKLAPALEAVQGFAADVMANQESDDAGQSMEAFDDSVTTLSGVGVDLNDAEPLKGEAVSALVGEMGTAFAAGTDAAAAAGDFLHYACVQGEPGQFLLEMDSDRAVGEIVADGETLRFPMLLVGAGELGNVKGVAYKTNGVDVWWFFGLNQAGNYYPVALSENNRNYVVFCGANRRRVQQSS